MRGYWTVARSPTAITIEMFDKRDPAGLQNGPVF
ncbi:hypothetical protein K788_00007210 (plasmid) [Paraburkholderia caribensis MBA4]|uniref:Uncharacterized protein n=1 Tax=Paraburkholderia caribensis MBA4 TaxID=1323664 RepID=A0A0P0RN12_9BURK|nr:hypothetical protein K788_00007210 [Paraburkholderia caribensis MBA4]